MPAELRKSLEKYRNIFALPGGALGRTNCVQHLVGIVDSAPIKQRLQRVQISTSMIAETEIQKMLDHGVIELSESP